MRFVGVYAVYVIGGACGLAGRQEYGGASSLLSAKNRTPPDKKLKKNGGFVLGRIITLCEGHGRVFHRTGRRDVVL